MTNKELHILFSQETKLSAEYNIEEYLIWLEKKVITFNKAFIEVIEINKENTMAGIPFIPRLNNLVNKWDRLESTK
jgi:hypothetical protein